MNLWLAAIDYLALRFVDSLRWDGFTWGPSAIPLMRKRAREWGVSQEVVTRAIARGYAARLPGALPSE